MNDKKPGTDSNLTDADTQRYEETPVYLYFERFIRDVIGQLSTEDAQLMDESNIHKVFGTDEDDWRNVLVKALELSDTIDIAILDKWISDRARFIAEHGDDAAWRFSQMFTDEYTREDSDIDVWHGDALDQARKRIAQNL